jgi:hypothetical protein
MNYEEYVWWVDDRKIAIAYKNANGSFSFPSDGKQVLMYVRKNPDGLITTDASWLDEDTEITDQFHMGIVNGVIADLYLRQNSDPRLAPVFDMKYQKSIADASKYSSGGSVDDFVRPVDYEVF